MVDPLLFSGRKMTVFSLLLSILVSAIGADGWTVLKPSADSRVVYVSSSMGVDTNDGLTEATPVRTLPKAITLVRNDMPDWVLLKKGDVFPPGVADFRYPGYIEWKKGGRSAAEPMVVSSYGSGERPVLNGTCLFAMASNEAVGFSLDNLSFVGVAFHADNRAHLAQDDPYRLGNTNALKFFGGQTNILIEDCEMVGYNTPLRFSGGTLPATGITIRRNAIYDNEELGIYIAGADHLLIEENIWDHNGFQNGVATKFNHNIYVKEVVNTTIRRNIISRGSNFGVKLSSDKPGGVTDFVIEDNLFYDNGIGLDHSAGSSGDVMTTFTHQRGVIRGNVFTERVRTQSLVGWLLNTEDVLWEANIYTHNQTNPLNPNVALIWTEHHRNVTLKDNIVWDWPNGGHDTLAENATRFVDGFVETGRQEGVAAASYSDPNRTTGTFYASLGGVNDATAFIESRKAMSRDSWDSRFHDGAEYFAAGFLPASVPPVEPPVDPPRDFSRLESALIAAAREFLAIMEDAEQ